MPTAPPTRTRVANVLVIGTGGAGMRAAIAAHQAGRDVLLVGRRRRDDAHTVLAAGGINAALGTVDPEDSWEQHLADTLEEGYMLGDPRAVETLVREAPAAIHELAEWGAPFARTDDGRLDQRFFGAHRWRRTCYAGDWTGRAILRTLGQQVSALGIPVTDHLYVTELLVKDGTCMGAFAFDPRTGERTVLLADAVVLAAGGHTGIWRRSSSRAGENLGEGMRLALRAGTRLADMELVQFHPTGMLRPEELAGTLVTEAVRGEGGILRNADGERFMDRYDPERRELSTRDRVALANYTEILEGRGTPGGGVLLDVSHLPRERILERLPRMYRQFLDHQFLDITREPMEVAPTAHYSMGGVPFDPATCATDVDGLYVAGEVTAGVHGANRLGGNSLAETVVFGRLAGVHAAARSAALPAQPRDPQAVRAAGQRLDALVRRGSEFARPLLRAVQETMWAHGGVMRDGTGLRLGLGRLAELRVAAVHVEVQPTSEGWGDLADVHDLHAALDTAEATLLGALERRETRGAHNRADHPQLDVGLQVSIEVRADADGRMTTARAPLPPLRDELHSWVEGSEELTAAGRLLE